MNTTVQDTSVFDELAVNNAIALDILAPPTRDEFRTWLLACSPDREFTPHNSQECPFARFFQDSGRDLIVGYTDISTHQGNRSYRSIAGTWMERVQKAWNYRMVEKRGQCDPREEFVFTLTRDEVLEVLDRQMGYA